MSNFDSTKNTSKKRKTDATTTSSPTATPAKVRWSYIQSDLDTAAAEWSSSQNAPLVKTPEEEQLEKVKNIIEDLKEKLNEF